MNIAPVQPQFNVVFVVDMVAEEIVIGGIFSKSEDAAQFEKEWRENPANGRCRDTLTQDRMTMDQIKTSLLKDRLLGLAAVLERIAPKSFRGERI